MATSRWGIRVWMGLGNLVAAKWLFEVVRDMIVTAKYASRGSGSLVK